MKTSKKLLALLLTTIMLISVFAVGFTSFAAAPKVINRVDITLRTDIAGFTTKDYKKIFTINTPGVTYDDQRPEFPEAVEVIKDGEYGNISATEKLVANNNYHINVCIAANEGYTFTDDTKVYVNGQLANSSTGLKDIYMEAWIYNVNVTERSFFDKIKDFFADIIASILDFFGSLFNR